MTAVAERTQISPGRTLRLLETSGNDAFRLEYGLTTHESALYKDIESYLGEYRFNIPKYQYGYNFTDTPDGARQLRDTDENISMVERCLRTIEKRSWEGKSTKRENAELLGMKTINSMLETATPDDMLVWLSPPGSKEDGYGDYGFCFVGTVKQSPDRNPANKSVAMTAVRVENPTVQQYSQFMGTLQNKEIGFQDAEEFLANPILLRGLTPTHIYSVLPEIFSFDKDSRKEQIFRDSMTILHPHILEFINMVRSGQPKDKLREAFNAIEVFSERLRDRSISITHERRHIRISNDFTLTFDELVAKYGQEEASVVAGSCGSTGTTANVLNKYSTLSEILSPDNQSKNNTREDGSCSCGEPAEDHFHCPGGSEPCHEVILIGKNITSCPSCGKEATCT